MERALELRNRGNIASESGVTLVELMITMVISSVVIFFLFSIQTRMSRAYQGQSLVPEITQNLQAAKQMLVMDMRMAGYGFPTGVSATAPPGYATVVTAVDASASVPGLLVSNNATGDDNDSIRIFYGDASSELVVSGINLGSDRVTIAPSTPIPSGYFDGVTLTPLLIASENNACIVAITTVNTTKIKFRTGATGAPYNIAGSSHCNDVDNDFGANSMPVRVMKLIAHSYRIDPSRPESGFLQMSPSGEVVAGDWIDMGIGFTNLQFATRFSLSTPLGDLDNDGDVTRDWFSAGNQVVGAGPPTGSTAIEASVSVEARSPFGTKGTVASAATPAFTDTTNKNNNPVGDWGSACPGAATDPCGVDFSGGGAIPARYSDSFVYRASTTSVDLRNMGIGK